MISGTILGRGVAGTQGRVTVPYSLVKPDKSVPTLAAIAIESRRWRTTVERYRDLVRAGNLPASVAQRAQFTDEALATAAEMVRLGRRGVSMVQAEDGRVLGVSQYDVIGREGYLHLQATDPDHIPGSPGTGQIRGIGTALVSAVSREMLAAGADTLYVKPLDPQASEFWQARGFAYCGGQMLCVRGRAAIEALKGGCEARPDCPDQGDCLICGLPEDTQAMRVPVGKARVNYA